MHPPSPSVSSISRLRPSVGDGLILIRPSLFGTPRRNRGGTGHADRSARNASEQSDAHAQSLPGRAVDDEIRLGILLQRSEHEC